MIFFFSGTGILSHISEIIAVLLNYIHKKNTDHFLFMKLKQAKILVVDDDPDVLTAVLLLLKTQAQEVTIERNPDNMVGLLAKTKYDVLLLDMNFISTVNTGNEGLFWLRKAKQQSPETAMIMITAYGGIDIAVRSLKEGADDFIVKPWHNDKLIETIEELLDRRERKKIRRSSLHFLR